MVKRPGPQARASEARPLRANVPGCILLPVALQIRKQVYTQVTPTDGRWRSERRRRQHPVNVTGGSGDTDRLCAFSVKPLRRHTRATSQTPTDGRWLAHSGSSSTDRTTCARSTATPRYLWSSLLLSIP